MPQIDDDILAAQAALEALVEQRHEQRGYQDKYKIIDNDTGKPVRGGFVLFPARSIHDRRGLNRLADSLEAAGLRPGLVQGIRDWIFEIENPPEATVSPLPG